MSLQQMLRERCIQVAGKCPMEDFLFDEDKSLSDAVRLGERAIKELIGPLEEVSCQTCKPHHKIKTFKYNEESVMEKVKLLFTTQELNTFCKKRKTAMLIYGNSLVLLNPMFSYCPLCGCIKSLGHFNEVFIKGEKLARHIQLYPLQSTRTPYDKR